MAFPRRFSRSVSLRNGQQFEYFLNRDWDCRDRWLVVKQIGFDGQYLFVNPYHHDFLPGKATIRNAIRAAFRLGWTPDVKKPPIRLKFDSRLFIPTGDRLHM